MLKSVIDGLDDTKAAQYAQAYAISLAKQHGAKLTGACVVDVPFLTAPDAEPLGAGYYKALKDSAQLERAKTDSANILAAFCEKCRQIGVPQTTATYHGDPYTELLKAAATSDIIVIGRDTSFHDGDEGERPVGESVARLVKDNPRPLIVTPPEPPAGDAVLLAYDGSLPALRAEQLFALLGLANGKPVQVISIHEEKAVALALAEDARAFLLLHGVKAEVQGIVSDADPADILLAEMKSLKAGLMAMGAYGHHGWREKILGSCTKTLLRQSAAALFLHH
jgi:nucleotide-binding universal stress UspA family protein